MRVCRLRGNTTTPKNKLSTASLSHCILSPVQNVVEGRGGEVENKKSKIYMPMWLRSEKQWFRILKEVLGMQFSLPRQPLHSHHLSLPRAFDSRPLTTAKVTETRIKMIQRWLTIDDSFFFNILYEKGHSYANRILAWTPCTRHSASVIMKM